MARKLNPPKLNRQNNAGTPSLNRRSAPPVAALYLMQLREQMPKISPEPRRVHVEIHIDNGGEKPQPVKIKLKD